MRILVISRVAWRDDVNAGNVLTNVFEDFDAEFAMISCSSEEPNNPICRHYYQVTDGMMVSHLLRGEKIGRRLEYDAPPSAAITQEDFAGTKKWIPGNLLRFCREFVWIITRWDKNELYKFIDEFKPDVIYAPCQGVHYMIRLVKTVATYAKVPVISYISDDFYTNNQYSFSPIFWLNHFVLRKNVRDIFKYYSLCYTMTDEQKEQCERDFGVTMKVLRKSGDFDDARLKTSVGAPIKIVYGGNLMYNRVSTLKSLAEAIGRINEDELRIRLDIYTNTSLKGKELRVLNDGKNSFVHGLVSPNELMQIYGKSDVALHAESFDRKYRHIVRMSFSTKIIDCLDSGCAVIAICDEKQAGGAYLRRNDCAICINDPDKIEKTLREIVRNPEMLIKYQHKAFEIGRKKHRKENTSRALYQDFCEVIKKGDYYE